MDYIADYIASYKTKIQLLNRQGLFDNATLFELFAENVCSLWFGKTFKNLNLEKSNYPYVDLISEDGKIFIQVSTGNDIPTKIRTTLEKIRDSKKQDSKKITKVFFFMLGNSSAKNVKVFSGKNKIGNIEFNVSENLITTDSVLRRAKNDLDFQIKLFKLLKKDSENIIANADKYLEVIKTSKQLINLNIENLINNEYEIDRTDLIARIKSSKSKYITINGAAGAGKSALCKKLLQDEENILYLRAEKIADAKSTDELWGINITYILKLLGDKKLVIYVDALEFIADLPKTKLDILQELYILASNFSNVIILSTCRTSDKAAFLKIENMFNVESFTVDLLDDHSLALVCEKYGVVKKLAKQNEYSQLLRTPFYLNLIVSKVKNPDELSDINDLRNLIWHKVICLDGVDLPSGINNNDIKKAVIMIVTKRAVEFLSGIYIDEIGTEIRKLLFSHGIITFCDEHRIRLKYDIFEDICFENIFDKNYVECKGDYIHFYSKLSSLGKCSFRRYQIWVENKLFTKRNRDDFLYSILNKDSIPSIWKNQTIIGIVKSEFCSEFFAENGSRFSLELHKEFIKLTNLYAFQANIVQMQYNNVYLKQKPIGKGRENLINMVYKKDSYKNENLKPYIEKLCVDYSSSEHFNDEAGEYTCKILEYYFEEEIKDIQTAYFRNEDKLTRYLSSIYLMTKYAKEWIQSLWKNISNDYLNGDRNVGHIAEKLIKFTLKNTTATLALYIPYELCRLANVYWFTERKIDDNSSFYHNIDDEQNKALGFSKKGSSYHFEFRHIMDNGFLNMICNFSFWIALDWIIDKTNYIALELQKNGKKAITEVEILTEGVRHKKKFLCNPEFWLVGVQENRVHDFISDAIYILGDTILSFLKILTEDEKVDFLLTIKQIILTKSNNIMPLTIINRLGCELNKIIPGYAVCLASSIELIYLDFQKAAILRPDVERKLLENQVMLTMGIPELEHRYKIDLQKVWTLQEYMCSMQMIHDDALNERIHEILDYLYSKYPNSGETANCNLQIQKMDFRRVSIRNIKDDIYEIEPEINGEAQKIVSEYQKSKYFESQTKFKKILDSVEESMKDKEFSIEKSLSVIDSLLNLSGEAESPYLIENYTYMLMACVLTKKDISLERRSQLCNIWLDGIDRIFNNGIFVCDAILSKIFFSQLENELKEDVRRRFAITIINCLLYQGSQGVIRDITRHLKKYLSTNKSLAKKVFNTIVAIAKDEMTENMHNAAVIKAKEENFTYIPNRHPRVSVATDNAEFDYKIYKSKRDEIIEHYLVRGCNMEYSNFNISDYNLNTLCYIANCGLSLSDADFKSYLTKTLLEMVNVIFEVREYYKFLDIYAISEVEDFFGTCLTNGNFYKDAVDILFDDINFEKLNQESCKFYNKIASNVMIAYFDAFSDIELRKRYEDIIKYIEQKISLIKLERAKKELTSMLMLTTEGLSMVNLNKCNTKYSFADKIFLNEIWGKYANLNFEDYMVILYQFHISELLPEILISLSSCLENIKDDKQDFYEKVYKSEVILNEIITKAYLDYNDEIKSNYQLTDAYENVLKSLIETNLESAAVLLDDFRIH